MMEADVNDVFDIVRVDRAIVDVCSYFDEHGLTLYERWHVCNSIEKAALGIMGDAIASLLADVPDQPEEGQDAKGQQERVLKGDA